MPGASILMNDVIDSSNESDDIPNNDDTLEFDGGEFGGGGGAGDSW